MDNIEKANATVKQASKKVHQLYRLNYHFMAPANWINDPNGFIHFNHEYHLFYQCHPYSENWGPMHWGHAKSKDLLHWDHLPIALAPSEKYDKDGCFSGSAVNNQGVLTLIYTGHVTTSTLQQTQCLATSKDGLQFEKSPLNPIIKSPPKEGSCDFRDPKVWKHLDDWYMVVGTVKNERGRVLLYKSSNLLEWNFVGVVAESENNLEYMWECPDFFSLGTKDVLIVSPMDKTKKVRSNIYFVGTLNYETGYFSIERSGKLDYGYDYYAAQTLLDDQGRRVAIAWMDMWEREMPTKKDGWAGAMTLPRELTIDENGELTINPISEIKQLRKEKLVDQNLQIPSKKERFLTNGDSLEILVEFNLERCSSEKFGLCVRSSKEKQEETVIYFRSVINELTVDLDHSGQGDKGKCTKVLSTTGTMLTLHIFLDRSSIEVFTDLGKTVMTNRIYPKEDSLGVYLFSENGSATVQAITVWELKSVWDNT